MNNKWFQLGIAIMLWGWLAKNVVSHQSVLGLLFNNIANHFLPEQVIGTPGGVFLFGLFSIIYAVLAYFAIFYTESKSDE